MPTSDDISIKAGEGNTVRKPINLKEYGKRTPWNVSAASSINLEWTDLDGSDGTPVALSDATPGSDWANGVVVLVLSPSDITAKVGSYRFGVTVSIDGQVLTAARGTIDVFDRPGYTPPA